MKNKPKKKHFRVGRFIGSLFFFLVMLCLITAGGYYIIQAGEKSHFMIILVLFGLPALMVCAFVFIIADGTKQDKALLFMQKASEIVGSQRNQVGMVSYGAMSVSSYAGMPGASPTMGGIPANVLPK